MIPADLAHISVGFSAPGPGTPSNRWRLYRSSREANQVVPGCWADPDSGLIGGQVDRPAVRHAGAWHGLACTTEKGTTKNGGQETWRSARASCSRSEPGTCRSEPERNATGADGLPFVRVEVGSDDVVDWRARDVVGEMRPIPHDDVLVNERFPILVLVDLDLGSGDRVVVDLVWVVTQEPKVSLGIGVTRCSPVARSWGDRIAPPRRSVLDSPLPVVRRRPQAHDLVQLRVPIRPWNYWWVVEFADHVISGGFDVEVQPPVNVMVMSVADAGTRSCVESKPGTNRSVRVQPPLANVAVPARLHLADQDNLLARHVDRNAEEGPDV